MDKGDDSWILFYKAFTYYNNHFLQLVEKFIRNLFKYIVVSVSIFDVINKSVELANNDPEVLKDISHFGGEKLCFRFTDDVTVTVAVVNGKLAAEVGEIPDCKVVVKMSAIPFCEICDKTRTPSALREVSEVVKGELNEIIETVFALHPWFYALPRYYEKNSDFRRMVDERKQKR